MSGGGRLTWRDVAAPQLDLRDLHYSQANLGNAFNQLGDFFGQREEAAKTRVNNEFLGQLELTPDQAAQEALLQQFMTNRRFDAGAGAKAHREKADHRLDYALRDGQLAETEAVQRFGHLIPAAGMQAYKGNENFVDWFRGQLGPELSDRDQRGINMATARHGRDWTDTFRGGVQDRQTAHDSDRRDAREGERIGLQRKELALRTAEAAARERERTMLGRADDLATQAALRMKQMGIPNDEQQRALRDPALRDKIFAGMSPQERAVAVQSFSAVQPHFQKPTVAEQAHEGRSRAQLLRNVPADPSVLAKDVTDQITQRVQGQYPGLALVDALNQRDPDADKATLNSTTDAMERMVPNVFSQRNLVLQLRNDGYTFEEIETAANMFGTSSTVDFGAERRIKHALEQLKLERETRAGQKALESFLSPVQRVERAVATMDGALRRNAARPNPLDLANVPAITHDDGSTTSAQELAERSYLRAVKELTAERKRLEEQLPRSRGSRLYDGNRNYQHSGNMK